MLFFSDLSVTYIDYVTIFSGINQLIFIIDTGEAKIYIAINDTTKKHRLYFKPVFY